MGRLEGVQKGWVDLSCVTERPLLQRLARIPGRRDREAPASIHLSAWGLRTWLSATLLKTDVMASVALGEVGVGELNQTRLGRETEAGPRGKSSVPSSGYVRLIASPLPSDHPWALQVHAFLKPEQKWIKGTCPAFP